MLAATTARVRAASVAQLRAPARRRSPVVPTTSAAPRSAASARVRQRRGGHAGEVEDDVLAACRPAARSPPIGDAERAAARELAGVAPEARMARRLDRARDAQPRRPRAPSATSSRPIRPAAPQTTSGDRLRQASYSRSTCSSCARFAALMRRERQAELLGAAPHQGERGLHRDRVHLERTSARISGSRPCMRPRPRGEVAGEERVGELGHSRGTTLEVTEIDAAAAGRHDRAASGCRRRRRPRSPGPPAAMISMHLRERAARLLHADDVLDARRGARCVSGSDVRRRAARDVVDDERQLGRLGDGGVVRGRCPPASGRL